MAQTIFEKYGGFAAISRVVLSFYDKVLDSDVIGDFFEHVDMAGLVDHQTKFVAYLTGGPVDYAGSRLRQIHQPLGIQPGHFEEMKALLAATLLEHGFSEQDAETVMAVIESRRGDIVEASRGDAA